MDPIEAINFVLDPQDDNRFIRVLEDPTFPGKCINHHLTKDISAEYQQCFPLQEATTRGN